MQSIYKYSNEFNTLYNEYFSEEINIPFSRYTERMLKPGFWGGYFESLVISNLFKGNVRTWINSMHHGPLKENEIVSENGRLQCVSNYYCYILIIQF